MKIGSSWTTAFFVFAAACASEIPTQLDGGVDLSAGIDMTCGYGGEDLAWQYSALLHVRDATTNLNVPGPSFMTGTQQISASCFGVSDNADLSTTGCDAWALNDTGTYVVTVGAPGYANATVSIDNYSTYNGCAIEVQVDAVVLMTPSP